MAGIQLLRVASESDDDYDLVRKIRGGERRAFELLMRRYNRRLYRLARAVLHDRAEAEDALQEAYIAAFKSIGGYRGEAAVGTWLSRVVLNECLGRQRRSVRRQGLVPMTGDDPAEAMDDSVVSEVHRPDELAAADQMRSILEGKLQQLPESFRVVFILRSVEELSVEETAACLNVPAETVRSRHFRARALLREALARDIDIAERDVFDFGGDHCDRIVAAVIHRLG